MTRPIAAVFAVPVLILIVGCAGETADPGGDPGDGATSVPPASAVGALTDATVEASCGQCQFGLPGDGCDLAVRHEGFAWFVDGTGIDEHGDAHADDGFCNAVRAARVSGRVEDGRFVAESFALLPDDA